MNWNILNSTDRAHSQTKIGLVMAAIGLLALVAVAVIPGGVAAAEPVNETVDVTNETGSIYVEATFNDSTVVSDENATATVTITDSNGTALVDGETISGNASETIVEDWTVNESDPTGNYSVVVTADSGVVASSDLGTFSAGTGGGGGGADDADGWGTIMGVSIWIVVIGIVAAALLGHNREWWDLSEVAP